METTSKIRQVHRLPRPAKRYRRDQETKAENRPGGFDRNGFLKHRFIPVTDGQQEQLRQQEAVESDFFRSLSDLADLYLFTPLDVSGNVYPDNIRCAFRHAQLHVKAASPDVTLIVLQEENHPATLATFKPLNLPTTLYYVPVRPLWDLLQDTGQEPLAALLLSVFSYLYNVVRVPYYRDSSSYLYSTYEMISEWVEEDPDSLDTEDYEAQVVNLEAASGYGDQFREMLLDPSHLAVFEQRLNTFRPKDEQEKQLQQVCRKYFDLYQAYPGRSIFDNIHEGLYMPQEEERIYPEQYLSFFWAYDDCIYDSLFETVNAELQEKSVMDEPLALQLFDQPQLLEVYQLDFEEQLFELIEELNSLL
jgi:hypothetical protein